MFDSILNTPLCCLRVEMSKFTILCCALFWPTKLWKERNIVKTNVFSLCTQSFHFLPLSFVLFWTNIFGYIAIITKISQHLISYEMSWISEAYIGLCQTSMTELFVEAVIKVVFIFAKEFLIGSEISLCNDKLHPVLRPA